MLNRQKNDYYFNIFLNLARAMYMQLEKDWDKEAKLCGISYAQQHALWLLHVLNIWGYLRIKRKRMLFVFYL